MRAGYTIARTTRHPAGRAQPHSDVDLAVMLERLPGAMQRVQLRQDLSERLGHRVDLVSLDDASPIVRQASSTGAC